MADTTILTAAKAKAAQASISVDDSGQALGTSRNPLFINVGDASEAAMFTVKGSSEVAVATGATNAPAVISGRHDALVSAALPEMAERARQGGMYSLATPTANAFNFVAGWPTTRAEVVLFNGEPQGGKSYVIESAWVTTIVSPAASAALTLIGQIIASGAAPTDNTAVLITSRNGKPNYGGRALKAIANTAYAIASKWEVLGTTFGGAGAAQIGTSVYADLEGGWIIPPGGLFLLNAVSGTVATAGGLIGVTWSEISLPVV